MARYNRGRGRFISQRRYDGAIPGLPIERYHRPRGNVPGLPHAPRHVRFHRDDYKWGSRSEYNPNIHAPAAQSNEYVTDSDWESHQFNPSLQPNLFRPYIKPGPEEPEFDYDTARKYSEIFLEDMKEHYQQLSEGQDTASLAEVWDKEFSAAQFETPEMPMPHIDIDPDAMEQSPEEVMQRFHGITGALSQLQDALPRDHPDIVNLSAALNEMLDDPVTAAKIESFAGEPTRSKLGAGDPYFNDFADDVGEIVDHQMDAVAVAEGDLERLMPVDDVSNLEQIVESPSDIPIERRAYEDDLGPAGPSGTPGPGSLEQIMDEYQATDGHFSDSTGNPSYDGNQWAPESLTPEALDQIQGFMPVSEPGFSSPADEINSAIDQVARPGGMMENPYMQPDPAEQDPFSQAQQTFDEQMQFLADPFAMPGPFGPMGPMPGM